MVSGSTMDLNQHLNKTTEAETAEKRKPRCCNEFKMFLAALSLAFTCKTLGAVVTKSSITHIERRFEIPSSTAGLIDGSFEIGNLLVLVFVSYFGSRMHRPVLIGIGCFIMGTGSILTALPHFFMGYYRYSEESYSKPSRDSTSALPVCLLSQNVFLNSTPPEMVANGYEKQSESYMWVFVLMGNMLRGIGETPITPLGISYLDDFAEEGQSSFYLGIMNALSMTGPIIGYLMGSLVSKTYVDIGYVDLSTIRITPKDSRWVGAWWLSFIISGLLAIVSSIPFFFLPKSLDKPQKETEASGSLYESETKVEKTQTVNVIELEQNATADMPGLLQSLKIILSNAVYVLALLAVLLQYKALIGLYSYINKYLEQQYAQSTAESNMLLGSTTVPIVSAGFFMGGYVIKRFKFTMVGSAKFSFFTLLTSCIFLLLNLVVICEKKPVAGLTLTYDGSKPVATHISVPRSYCNSHCTCDESQWEPVCGDNGITYISPCLAGCTSSSGMKKPIVLYNCSCVEDSDAKNRSNSAYLGECPRSDHCGKKLYLFMILYNIGNFFFAFGSTANLLLTFKNVQPELKSLAVGFQALTLRALGGLAAPIYFGALIDRACMKWSVSLSGKPGTCRIYDSVLYGYMYLGLMGILKFSAIILFIVLIATMKKKYWGKDDEVSENERKDINEANLDSIRKTQRLQSSAKTDCETHF